MSFACSKKVELNLPVYKPKMVIEFYLENNKTLNCVLQESVNFTDTSFTTLISNAVVILRHNGINDTLKNQLQFDFKNVKIYNYHNPKVLKLRSGIKYELYVKDATGLEMTGVTELMPIVPIDTQIFRFDAKNMASAGIVFRDNGSTKDYYRIASFKDSVVINTELFRDIRYTDILFNGQKFRHSSRYIYQAGDTIISRLYHLTDDHNNYLQSVFSAISSNGNPFGQPANIQSNVTGGIGIFTTIVYDEKRGIAK